MFDIKKKKDGKPQKANGSLVSSLRTEVKVGLVAALVIICAGVLFTTHVVCVHSWKSATCELPTKCEICGATSGKAHGHKWGHASCTKPSTCYFCGKTKGKSLGHRWTEATCDASKTCSRCDAKAGAPLGHDVQEWTVLKEPSCTEEGQRQGTCARCGAVVTEATAKVEHTSSDWEIIQDVSVSATGYVTPGSQQRKCAVCGAVLETRAYTIEVTTSQRNALLTAASYIRMGGFSYKSLVEQLEFEGYSNEDSTFAADHCGADWMAQAASSARSYTRSMGFSRSGLIEQLEFEGFTAEQAEHGADSVGL